MPGWGAFRLRNIRAARVWDDGDDANGPFSFADARTIRAAAKTAGGRGREKIPRIRAFDPADISFNNRSRIRAPPTYPTTRPRLTSTEFFSDAIKRRHRRLPVRIYPLLLSHVRPAAPGISGGDRRSARRPRAYIHTETHNRTPRRRDHRCRRPRVRHGECIKNFWRRGLGRRRRRRRRGSLSKFIPVPKTVRGAAVPPRQRLGVYLTFSSAVHPYNITYIYIYVCGYYIFLYSRAAHVIVYIYIWSEVCERRPTE